MTLLGSNPVGLPLSGRYVGCGDFFLQSDLVGIRHIA
jgi:hypothetical protein